ncbi:MAG: pitrilysin family protein [bacterium]|nr:pitrilysin family protein [bacterium]
MNHSRFQRTAYNPIVRVTASGLTVIIDPVPVAASCALGVWVQAGTRDEARGRSGLAHFVEHTSFRRTRTLTTRAIAKQFEDVGAYANAFTTKEETCYYARTLSEHLPRVLETLSEVVMQPLFKAPDVEKERSIITEEIRAYEDEPEEFVFDAAERQLFGNHPLGMPILGTLSSVDKISEEDLHTFHNERYIPSKMAVCISGEVDAEEFMRLVEDTMQPLLPKAKRKNFKRTTPVPSKPNEVIIYKSVQQAHTIWQTPVPGYMAKDRHALMLLNVVLGDGMSSRLNSRIRESRGFAYNVYSQLQLFADCGVFAIYAGIDNKHVLKAQEMIGRELDILATEGVRISELNRGKEQLRASKIMSMESLTARMNMLGKGFVEEGKPEDLFATLRDIDTVTLDQVNKAAARYCKSAKWSRYLMLPEDDRILRVTNKRIVRR